MSSLADLGLTPPQLAEVETLSEELVSAWLAATHAQPRLERPAGWFLAGVRSGNMPGLSVDASERRALHLAERRVSNLGHLIDSERELVAELFGHGGLLEQFDSPQLRERMLAHWRQVRLKDIPWP